MEAHELWRKWCRDKVKNNPEKYRALNRASYQRHRAKRLEDSKRKSQTPEGRVRIKFKMAVDAGKLKRPSTCSQCGSMGRIEGHHPDYSKPYEVIWLCVPCHALTRRKEYQPASTNTGEAPQP